jgi:hypothetical protein
MFITSDRRGYVGTSQYASGLFLLVFTNENAPRLANGKMALRALVRKVALTQSGHFMTGHVSLPFAEGEGPNVRLAHARIWLSGSYGHDGLPIEITEYKRRNVPKSPETFETAEEHKAFYDALAKIPFEHVERVPGLWDRLHPLPDELVARFWSGGGHNTHGDEGSALREWALSNLSTLRHLR